MVLSDRTVKLPEKSRGISSSTNQVREARVVPARETGEREGVDEKSRKEGQIPKSCFQAISSAFFEGSIEMLDTMDQHCIIEQHFGVKRKEYIA